MLKKSLTTLCLISLSGLVSALMPLTANAVNDFKYDARLTEKLIEINMPDYAFRQIKRMKKQYPDRNNNIKILQASIYYSQNQNKQAKQLLQGIPESSDLYPRTRMMIAENAFKKGKFETAEKEFREYFRVRSKPPSENKDAVRRFTRAVEMYAQVLIEEGKVDKVADILRYLQNIEGETALTDVELTFLTGRATLMAMEKLQEKGKKINKDKVRKITEKLKNFQFEPGVSHLNFVRANLQAAHGHIILGENVEAIKTIKPLNELLARFDKQLPSSVSPLARAYYYYGLALQNLAEKSLEAGNREQAGKRMLAAAKRYRKIGKEFAGHEVAEKALMAFSDAQDFLKEKFDKTIKGLGTAGKLIQKKQADNFFSAKAYDKAAPLYLEAVRSAPLSKKIPPVGKKLSYCYAKTSNLLKAQTIALYLKDVFPDNQNAAEALLYVGKILFQKSNDEEKSSEAQEKLYNTASRMLEQFLEMAPEHKQAPAMAYLLAEKQYGQAMTLANKADEVESVKQKEKIKERARTRFEKAEPLYKRLIQEYGNTSKGIRAHYKLGWVYQALEQHKKAAEQFLAYVNNESDPQYDKDVLRAKLHAGYQLMQTDNPKSAIKHFTELRQWLQSDSEKDFKTNTSEAKKILEDAINYKAWAYDSAAEQIRPQVEQINDKIEAFEKEITKYTEEIKAAQKKVQTAEERIEDVEQKFEEKRDKLMSVLPPFQEQAMEEAMPSEETVESWGEEQEKLEMKKIRSRAERIASDYRSQTIQQLKGEISQLEESKDDVYDELQEYKQEIKKLTDSIQKKRENEEPEGLSKLEHRKKLMEKEASIADARLKEIAAKIKWNEQRIKLINAEADENLEAKKEEVNWSKVQENVVATAQQVKERKVEKNILIKTAAKEQIAEAKQKMANRRKKIARLENDRKPLKDELLELKEKSQKQFLKYVEKYPDSKYTAKNLARIGTNYLELNNYKQARKYLDKLAQQYPESKVIEDALFSLGKAQLETGNLDSAIDTFKKILSSKKEQTIGTLAYIGNQMLQHDRPELAITCFKELLRRSDIADHPDYARLKGAMREQLLFKAGKATYQAGKFSDTVEYLTKLLDLNENTARYYQVKLLRGKAERKTSPPNYDTARRDFMDIVRFADDPAVENKAIVELAKTGLKRNSKSGVKEALAQIGQIVLVSNGGVSILADEDIDTNKPLIEEAVYLEAKCYALTGSEDKKEALVKYYQNNYPEGSYAKQFQDLPTAEYEVKKPVNNADAGSTNS